MSRSHVVAAELIGCMVRTQFRILSLTRAIADNFDVLLDMPTVLRLDAGAGNKDVRMPNVATATSKDLVFFILNDGAANNLVIKTHDEGATIVTLAPGDGAMLHCNGVTWKSLVYDVA